MNNYLKLLKDGKIERLAFFDETEVHSVTAAMIRIKAGREVDPRDRHRMVVHHQAPLVPDHLPEVGDWYCPICQLPPEGCKGHRA